MTKSFWFEFPRENFGSRFPTCLQRKLLAAVDARVAEAEDGDEDADDEERHGEEKHAAPDRF